MSYALALAGLTSPSLAGTVPGQLVSDAATAQPECWSGQKLTWPILSRIGGTTFTLFGAPDGVSGAIAATTTGVNYTSTHTFYRDHHNYAEHSLPYSYFIVSATAAEATDIQILSGIDYTWTTQDGDAGLNYTKSETAGYFWFYNSDQTYYTESSDTATWGSILYGATTGDGLTYTCDTAANVYSNFTSNGNLSSTGTCGGSDLAAFSQNLGTVTAGQGTFAVGFQRDLAINYLGSAQTGVHPFDSAVRTKSEAVSSDWGSQYADIVEASVRQTFGATELTVPVDNTTASPQVFLEEISSDGNIQTIDVLFKTWPVYVSLNPGYLKMLLQPVLAYLDTEYGPMHGPFGIDCPSAIGHDDGVAEQMPLFENSSVFIMLYAHQKYTGDTSCTAEYVSLLAGYAEYLNQNSLYPASQFISVDSICPGRSDWSGNPVSHRLKAASLVLGDSTYSDTADTITKTVYNDAIGLDGPTLAESTHFTYYYGQDDTSNVLFPAYSDVLLELGTMQEGGLPFAGPITDTSYTGSSVDWGFADWNLLVAATVSADVQAEIVNTTHTFATNGLNSIPFGTKYYVEGHKVGAWVGNKARSTVGLSFGLLALDQGYWEDSY
ncbi:protein of unknown function DUF1793 [Penicillium occitanis (nom. inval.)]|nr:protein of unknown function DUF1793 [Penicillium occitanis (nom. inval.)]PCG95443.1 hypothetical protein PENOC_077630 [Penicillium occitanis (nom. inval.)]